MYRDDAGKLHTGTKYFFRIGPWVVAHKTRLPRSRVMIWGKQLGGDKFECHILRGKMSKERYQMLGRTYS